MERVSSFWVGKLNQIHIYSVLVCLFTIEFFFVSAIRQPKMGFEWIESKRTPIQTHYCCSNDQPEYTHTHSTEFWEIMEWFMRVFQWDKCLHTGPERLRRKRGRKWFLCPRKYDLFGKATLPLYSNGLFEVKFVGVKKPGFGRFRQGDCFVTETKEIFGKGSVMSRTSCQLSRILSGETKAELGDPNIWMVSTRPVNASWALGMMKMSALKITFCIWGDN